MNRHAILEHGRKMLAYFRIVSRYWGIARGWLVEAFRKRPEPIQVITILDYWRVIRQYHAIIAGVVLVSVLMTGVVSKFFLASAYEAKATFLLGIPDLGGGGFSFGGDKEKGSGGGGLVMQAMSGKSGPSQSDVLGTLLESRTMAEEIATQLNLIEYYGVKSLADAAAVVRSQVSSKAGRAKFEITVVTHDAKMAADIANTCVSSLDRLYRERNVSAAKRIRVFIEERLAEKSKLLAIAEEQIKSFQAENRSVALSDEAQGAVARVIDLDSQIVSLEIELAALRQYATSSHPMINQLNAQITELRSKLGKMEQDEGLNRRAPRSLAKSAFAPIVETPSLILELSRLTRRLKVEEAVYGMLVGMLEQAKINEARNLPTIQMLDPAVPPQFKSRPRTLQNVEASVVISLILGILLAFFLNYLEQVRIQETVGFRHVDDTGESTSKDSNGNGNGSMTVDGYSLPPKDAETARD